MAMATCWGRRIFVQYSYKSKNYAALVLPRNNHTLRIKACSPLGHQWTRYAQNKYYPITAIGTVRWASQASDLPPVINQPKSTIVIDESTLPPIPTPPVEGEVATSVTSYDSLLDSASQLTTEPSLASYGLAGWSPVGMIQQALEFIHLSLGVPWWGSIVIGTLVLRTLVFPLVIKAQKNAAIMSNNMPQFQRLQEKMTQARQEGNKFEAARLGQEVMIFMKEKNMNPLTSVLPPLAQAPLFISMFMGLRGMASAPVESFQTGGMLWFLDLTVPDQYYILPIITSLTLAATIEIGTDAARASTLGMMRYVLRAMPIIIFPFTMNFPGAVLCYWVSTNFISLIQVAVLRIPKVRNYFKIEPLVTHPQNESLKKKGFVEGFKDSMTNLKITRELNERDHLDSVLFQKAGRAPIQKTFKYDPTKRPSTTSELLAKKKDA